MSAALNGGVKYDPPRIEIGREFTYYGVIQIGQVDLLNLVRRLDAQQIKIAELEDRLEKTLDGAEELLAHIVQTTKDELERNNKEMRKMLEDRRPVLLSASGDLATGDTNLKPEFGATGGAVGGRNLTYE